MIFLYIERGAECIELIGIILKGRYCIVDRIGKGGQGALYLARDIDLGIYRAVKELPLERKKEAGFLRLLDHPSLPRMIDYTEQKDRCFLVMEYIQGKSLRQHLEEGRIFSAEEIISMGRRILDILSYLHSRKPAVYYGDLKPENLMLTDNGTLYLIDFGSAVLGYDRQKTMCYGTKGYAAPEQYQGIIKETSDIYAFGKTLESLCGKSRFQCFFQYPYLAFFIWKCCRIQPEKRWKNAENAIGGLKKLQPLSLKRWRGLALIMCGVMTAVLCFRIYMGVQKPLVSFETAVSSVISLYGTMDFQSEGKNIREIVFSQVEEHSRSLLYIYDRPDQQIRLLYLLAGNCELQENLVKAEGYYRQLTKERSAKEEEYAAYGLFLARQGRGEESLDLYEKFKRKRKKEKLKQRGRNFRIWNQYLKKYTEGDYE